jgi:CDP-paratose synthetase
MIKKILITGSRGFIGSALKFELQKKGYEVVGTHRSSQTGKSDEVLFEPFKQIELGNHANIEGIIHLAGEYLINTGLGEAERVNASIIGLTTSVAELAGKIRVPIIAAGSFFEKSSEPEILLDTYVLAKTQARRILEREALISEARVGIVFLYDNYSKNLGRGKFVDLVLEAAISRKILRASSGNQVLDLTHLSDICESLELALLYLNREKSNYVEFQARSYKTRTLRQIVEQVENIVGREIVYWGALADRKNSVYELWDSAIDVPNYKTTIEFETFIKEVLNDHKR